MPTHLLIIDPQQDFCDESCNGALAVPGAYQDMKRLADFVRRSALKIDAIHVSMDCHRLLDIAHPAWWRDAHGNAPDPFTIISAQDIQDGIWTVSRPETAERSLQYVKTLADQGNYPLCIWPPHCLQGTQGQSLHPDLASALLEWEQGQTKQVNFVTKGLNPWTEHYSAIEAEVQDPVDVGTYTNMDLILSLKDADAIIIAGEALSHCVKSTVEDLVRHMGDETTKKFIFLEDASSSVPGFEHLGTNFIQTMTDKGMRLKTTKEEIL